MRSAKITVSLAGFSLVELLVVLGVFSLIGVALSRFTVTSRNSFDVSEAQIQNKEHAKIAMERISQNLRLSRDSEVRITNSVGWNADISPNNGTVVNFQIPLVVNGAYDLNLTSSPKYALKWGDGVQEGNFLAYSVNGNFQLVQSSYSQSDGTGAQTQIICPHIVNLTFSRSSTTSNLVHTRVIAQIVTVSGQTINETLASDIKLRN